MTMTKDEAKTLFEEMGEEIPPKLLTPSQPEEKKRRGRKPRTSGLDGSGDTPPAPSRGIGKQIDEIRLGLTTLLMGTGKIVGNFNQFDGMVIVGGTESLVDAFCRAAAQNAHLRGYLLSMVHASAWGDIAMASALIIVPILANHNLLPFSFFPQSPAVDTNGHKNGTMG